MMKDRGIDALVNDCLISPVLTMGSTFVAYLCALLAFLYLQFTDPAYNSGGTFTPVIMAFSFLIGLQVCQIFTTPIGSGVDTIFVAAAWDPDVLMRDHPDFYSRMVAVYPKVQQMIHAWTLEVMVGSDRIFLPGFSIYANSAALSSYWPIFSISIVAFGRLGCWSRKSSKERPLDQDFI